MNHHKSFFQKIYFYFLIIRGVRNFHIVFLNQFGLLKKQFVTLRFNNGLKFICRSNSADIKEAIIICLTNEYPSKYFDFIDPGSTILDLGAHIGTFSLHIKKQYPDLKIYSIEPSTVNYSLLIKNIELNSLEIKTIKSAIGNFNGTAKFNIGGESDSWHLDNNNDVKVTESVEVKKLSSLIKDNNIENIKVIKMDIEGEEFKVLEDAKDVIINCKTILLEYHSDNDQETINWLKKYFTSLGFKFNVVSDHIVAATKN